MLLIVRNKMVLVCKMYRHPWARNVRGYTRKLMRLFIYDAAILTGQSWWDDKSITWDCASLICGRGEQSLIKGCGCWDDVRWLAWVRLTHQSLSKARWCHRSHSNWGEKWTSKVKQGKKNLPPILKKNLSLLMNSSSDFQEEDHFVRDKAIIWHQMWPGTFVRLYLRLVIVSEEPASQSKGNKIFYHSVFLERKLLAWLIWNQWPGSLKFRNKILRQVLAVQHSTSPALSETHLLASSSDSCMHGRCEIGRLYSTWL